MQPEEIKMQSPLLSVIIISHNQRSELKRCVDSVLAQDIPFAYEIILSDDRSTDGTFELAQEYAARFPFITASQCNSDECEPFMTSERAGFNRINGLKFARGKYVVHVDGDDYYVGNDCFKRQVEMLEQHPECNICCQNYVSRKDGEEAVDCMFSKEKFSKKVISIDEFVRKMPYIHNSACCLRRSSLDNKLPCFYQYDDVDITYLYIGKGKVAVIDSCDFVYMRYNHITASKFASLDQSVLWNTTIFNSLIAPQCVGTLFRNEIFNISRQINLSLSDVKLQDETLKCLYRYNAYLLKSFGKRGVKKKIRLLSAKVLVKIVVVLEIERKWIYKLLYKLLICNRIPSTVDFNRLIK